MIDIPFITRGAFDHNSVSDINNLRHLAPLSSGNITNLNTVTTLTAVGAAGVMLGAAASGGMGNFGINNGQYGNGQTPNAQYGNTQFPNDPYGSGQYGNNPYGNNQFDNNQYGNNQYGNGQYSSQFSGGQQGYSGQYGTGGQQGYSGQYGAGVQQGNAGQFGAGGQQGYSGQYGAGVQQGNAGQFGAGVQPGNAGQYSAYGQGGQYGQSSPGSYSRQTAPGSAAVPNTGTSYQANMQPGRNALCPADMQTAPGSQSQSALYAGGNISSPAAQAPTGSVPLPPPPERPPLALDKPVRKGQKVTLSMQPLKSITAYLDWNVKDGRCDIDVSAFLLGENGKVPGDDWFVFYGQPESPDASVQFNERARIGRQSVHIDFSRISGNVKKVTFVLTINEAAEQKLNFSMVKDACVKIVEDATGKELTGFRMDEYYDNVISMMIGEIYAYKDSWKFNAIGNGVARDLSGLCELYGVQVSD